MASSSVTLKDGNGASFAVAVETNNAVNSPHSVPEVAGTAVSASNPLPVSVVGGAGSATSANQALVIAAVNNLANNTLATSTAAGTPSDTAWSSGSGSIIGLLKAIWAKLGAIGGTVAVTNPISITVTTVALAAGTDAQLLAANANRKYLSVTVTGGNDAYLGFGATAVAGSGVAYGPSGQMTTRSWGTANGVPTQAIHAVSVIGTTIVVEEGI